LSANFWCWVPALALAPSSPDFLHRVDSLHDAPFKPPAHAIVEFVNGLTRKYPDLSVSGEGPWADGPMIRDANGAFIDFSITWDGYEHVIPFVLSTARRSGLDCYDPQDYRCYPTEGRAVVIIPPAGGASPITDAAAAIKKARHVCRLGQPASAAGEWQATLIRNQQFGDEWHVWFGNRSEPACGFYGATVKADGSYTDCSISLCKSLPPKPN
jgi:hypothetical protein